MLGLISFKKNGERLGNAREVPAFYALTYNGHIIGYYTTLEALRAACDDVSAVIREEAI